MFSSGTGVEFLGVSRRLTKEGTVFFPSLSISFIPISVLVHERDTVYNPSRKNHYHISGHQFAQQRPRYEGLKLKVKVVIDIDTGIR